MVFPPRGPLLGDVVRLDPAVPADAAELFAALDHETVWAAGFGGGLGSRWRAVEQAERRLAQDEQARAEGRHAAYVVRLRQDSSLGAAGTVVGTSSLGDWNPVDRTVQLGWTAYGPQWWGTAVNPEAKLLLFTLAFDTCGMGRVQVQTDLVNERSQAAIAKLGATREGVLRRHRRRGDGSFRDTVVFSVLDTEWPSVREWLQARLR